MRQVELIARARPLAGGAVVALAIGLAGGASAQVSPVAPQSPAVVQPPAGDLPRAPAAPGTIAVDEDEVTRALERALVLEGAQVLPPGVLQVQPSLSYARREEQFPFLAESGGQAVAVERTIEQDTVSPGITFRIGLPYDTQAELQVPYRFDRTSVTDRTGFTFLDDTTDRTDGFGDIRIGVTKALVREGEMLPGLLANVYWDTDTGRTDSFNEVGVTLTAVRTQDPLVFIGRASYERAFESGGTRPGDTFGFSAGMALAVTPETSWRVTLDQDFERETRLSGSRVGGSDRDITVLSLGINTVIQRDAVLDVAVGVGLSDDAPDYSVSLSVPIRFSGIF